MHQGHVQIARYLLNHELVEQFLFVPAGVPPHKRHRPITADHHRLAMLELVVAQDSRMAVTDLELRREGPSYTIDTAVSLAGQFGDQLRLVLGMDSLRDLHLWHRAEELVQNFRFLIYRRPGVPVPAWEALAEHFSPEAADRLLAGVVDGPEMAVSATEIRQRLRQRKPVVDLLIPAVYDYIAEHELYTEEQA